MTRTIVEITPPCMACGHTRTVHERTGIGQAPLASCLVDWCRCERYVKSNVAYAWVDKKGAA